VKELPRKNLAIETLRKLLTDEIKGRARKNLVQSRQFSEMLEETIRKYTARITLGIYGQVIGNDQRNAVQNRSARRVN